MQDRNWLPEGPDNDNRQARHQPHSGLSSRITQMSLDGEGRDSDNRERHSCAGQGRHAPDMNQSSHRQTSSAGLPQTYVGRNEVSRHEIITTLVLTVYQAGALIYGKDRRPQSDSADCKLPAGPPPGRPPPGSIFWDPPTQSKPYPMPGIGKKHTGPGKDTRLSKNDPSDAFGHSPFRFHFGSQTQKHLRSYCGHANRLHV